MVVGMQGIEPCTSCSQSKHATGAPHPVGMGYVISRQSVFFSLSSGRCLYKQFEELVAQDIINSETRGG
jgi:hypothetical protein